MPEGVREILERAGQLDGRNLTKELHKTTSALGTARRVLQESQSAQTALKKSWLEHLQRTLKQLEAQKLDYNTKLLEMQEAAKKARVEVRQARKTLTMLNAQAAATEDGKAPVIAEEVDSENDVELLADAETDCAGNRKRSGEDLEQLEKLEKSILQSINTSVQSTGQEVKRRAHSEPPADQQKPGSLIEKPVPM